jgi:hypothetical protein
MSAYFRARPQCINMQAKQPVAVANRGVRNGYRRGEGLWLPTQNIRRYDRQPWSLSWLPGVAPNG